MKSKLSIFFEIMDIAYNFTDSCYSVDFKLYVLANVDDFLHVELQNNSSPQNHTKYRLTNINSYTTNR